MCWHHCSESRDMCDTVTYRLYENINISKNNDRKEVYRYISKSSEYSYTHAISALSAYNIITPLQILWINLTRFKKNDLMIPRNIPNKLLADWRRMNRPVCLCNATYYILLYYNFCFNDTRSFNVYLRVKHVWNNTSYKCILWYGI